MTLILTQRICIHRFPSKSHSPSEDQETEADESRAGESADDKLNANGLNPSEASSVLLQFEGVSRGQQVAAT